MRLFKYFVIILTFLGLYQDSNSQNCPVSGETCKYNTGLVLTDSIPKGYNYPVPPYSIKGNGTIFRYLKIYDCPERFDEEMLEEIQWFVPDTATSFNIVLNPMDKSQIILYNYINIGRGGYWLISRTGNITGTLSGENWKVSIDVTAMLQKGSSTPIERKIQVEKLFEKTVYVGKKKNKPKDGQFTFFREGKGYY